jgi:uncharacterized protein
VSSRGPRLLLIAALTAAAGYLALCALAWGAQRALLYPAPPGRRTPRFPNATLLHLPGASGASLALHAPAAPGRPTVVHFHGNGEDLADQGWLVQALTSAGLGVLAVEYPGYGQLHDRAPSEAAILDGAAAAVAHAETTFGPVVLLGISLGSGVAVELARRGHGRRLALVTPYTSIPDAAAHHFPWLPVRRLLRDRFDSASKAAQVLQPTLVIHGTADEVIPFALGEQLSKLLPHARLLAVPGAHHNDVLSGAALDELIRFLRDG